MKLACLRVKGFRCFEQECTIDFGAFTSILGRNDVGKSSFFEALQIFFEDGVPDAGDISKNGDKEDVRIICEFDDLPQQLVIDVDHPTTLAGEYLLNSNGRLEIHKVYNGALKTPKATKVLVYAQHPSVDGLNDLLRLKNKELKDRAAQLDVDLARVDKSINTEIRRALWASKADLVLKPQYLSVDDETAKKIWEQLKNYLPTFALFKADRPSTDQDAEAQDPIKAAVAEALKKQEIKLDEIRKEVELAVLGMADLTVAKLREMDPDLAKQLKPNIQRPNWASAFKVSLTDDAEIPVNKRGSGVRRLILINFFRAKAEQKNEERSGSGVFYAIEEPETSQHPNSQKMLLRALFELSEVPGYQVAITTHNPGLARDLPTGCLRLVRKGANDERTVLAGAGEVFTAAAQDLGVLPDNAVKAFIGVEGINDVNFLKTLSSILSKHEADIPNLVAEETAGRIVFIPAGGSNLGLWVSRLEQLNRPEFHLYDRDTQPPVQPKYAHDIAVINGRRNCWAESTEKLELENYIHPDAIRFTWPKITYPGHGDFEDVPNKVAQILNDNGQGPKWAQLNERKRKSQESNTKARLSTDVVARMNPAMLTQIDPNDQIRKFLRKIAQALSA